MEISAEKVQLAVKGADAPMAAHLAVPAGAGPWPAVLVIEEIFGVNAHIRDVTERVAREGYVALAPHIHHRAAPELDLPYTEEGMKQGMAVIPKLTAEGLDADLAASLAFLRGRADVKGDRIGIMGFCIGGHVAYYAACTTDVKAAASFYGGGIANFSPGGGAPTVTRTGGIKGRILCLFGADDPMIPMAQVETIKQALAEHQVRHEVVVYPGASHAFFRDVHPASYRAEPAEDAWQRVKQLFREELG
jgi:carboxymethylenebutenolidase